MSAHTPRRTRCETPRRDDSEATRRRALGAAAALGDAPAAAPRGVPPEATDGLFAVELEALSSRDAANLLARAADRGYEQALLNLGVEVLREDTRKGERRIVDDQALAAALFERLRPHLPQTYGSGRWVLRGLNERLRFLRYRPGDYFRVHRDGSYVRPNGERSFLTVLVYLDDAYEGGRTTLYGHAGGAYAVSPSPGRCLVHEHHILHESPDLMAGVKHVIRTDVMYAPAEALEA